MSFRHDGEMGRSFCISLALGEKSPGIRADSWCWSGVETLPPPLGLLLKRRNFCRFLGHVDAITLTGSCGRWLQAPRHQHKKARTLPAPGPFRHCSVILGNARGIASWLRPFVDICIQERCEDLLDRFDALLASLEPFIATGLLVGLGLPACLQLLDVDCIGLCV